MPKLNTYPTLADLPTGFRFIGYNPGDGAVFDTNAVPRNVMRDFILSVVPVIKGDDGDQVELRANETHLQWRYVGDPAWIDLVPLTALKGNKGDNGDRVQLQSTGGFIQWKYETGNDWTNLVPLTALKGDKGEAGTGLKNRGQWVTGTTYQPGDYVFDTGSATASSMWILSGETEYLSSAKPSLDLTHWVEFVAPAGQDGLPGDDGREVEMRKGSTTIQWRYTTNDPTWKDIITLAELKGADGVGTPGTNGKSAEWQKSATHIQWRLVGDSTWINIVPLTDIKGDVGASGKGVPAGGAAGYILSKVSVTDFDTQWIVAPTGGGGGSGMNLTGDQEATGVKTFKTQLIVGTAPSSGAPAIPAGTGLVVYPPAVMDGAVTLTKRLNLKQGIKNEDIIPITPASGVATLTPYNAQQKIMLTADVASLALKMPDASGSENGGTTVYPIIEKGSIFRVFFPFAVAALTITPGRNSFWWENAKVLGAPASIIPGFYEIQFMGDEQWYWHPYPGSGGAAGPFTKKWTSAAITQAVSSDTLLTHNLGDHFKLAKVYVVAKTSPGIGVAVGERVDVAVGALFNGTTTYGCQFFRSAANTVTFTIGPGGLVIIRPDTKAAYALTNAPSAWDIFVELYG